MSLFLLLNYLFDFFVVSLLLSFPGLMCLLIVPMRYLTVIYSLSIIQRADLRWNRRLEDMEELTNLQDALLDAASK